MPVAFITGTIRVDAGGVRRPEKADPAALPVRHCHANLMGLRVGLVGALPICVRRRRRRHHPGDQRRRGDNFPRPHGFTSMPLPDAPGGVLIILVAGADTAVSPEVAVHQGRNHNPVLPCGK